ncbi:MAG: urea carboxylase-associated family protein [Candidatus Dormibacteraeota bacterium]|uniref:Urea carboxylase-associated family protein n=1 Tax=Candidatus Dormiibacter inghamiae TaxID=3127013 RepID=A0A934KDJ2_9BACT|nr:urea carboxylase-associated family protein [Candidatus Dormibacteraeota bacterium]MBJ7605936.1 urea carboxylase-associated family protein [Candidatus Dormibacteraeota bacterium]
MTDVNRARLAPQTGTAFRLAAGQRLRVVDPCGEQVADLMAFAAHDLDEVISSGRSLDYNETLYLTTGHILYSNRSRPLLTIERDDVGRHDFLLTPCSRETFRIIYKQDGHHPSCLENLSRSLAPFGATESRIATTFNVFMNVQVAADGRLTVARPLSHAGDQIVFRAELDLIVGLTACSAEMSNNYAFKPIDYEVFN